METANVKSWVLIFHFQGGSKTVKNKAEIRERIYVSRVLLFFMDSHIVPLFFFGMCLQLIVDAVWESDIFPTNITGSKMWRELDNRIILKVLQKQYYFPGLVIQNNSSQLC